MIAAFTWPARSFDPEPLWDQIDALDCKVDAKFRSWTRSTSSLPSPSGPHHAGCFASAPRAPTLPTLIQRYQPAARELRANLAAWLPAPALDTLQQATSLGASRCGFRIGTEFGCTGVHLPGARSGSIWPMARPSRWSRLHAPTFGVETALGLTQWRTQINRLPTDTPVADPGPRQRARATCTPSRARSRRSLLSRREALDTWQTHHAQPLNA